MRGNDRFHDEYISHVLRRSFLRMQEREAGDQIKRQIQCERLPRTERNVRNRRKCRSCLSFSLLSRIFPAVSLLNSIQEKMRNPAAQERERNGCDCCSQRRRTVRREDQHLLPVNHDHEHDTDISSWGRQTSGKRQISLSFLP